MDFQKLLKQAANNQATVQKRFQEKKQVVENERTQARIQETEKKKEAKKKLKKYEEETHKGRLMYKGLISNSGVLQSVAIPSSSISSSKTGLACKGNSVDESHRHSQAFPSAKSEKNKDISSKGSSHKSLSPQPQPTQNKNPPSHLKTMNLSKNKTPPPGRIKHSIPTDFQELMKLAQKNSTSVKSFETKPAKSYAKESELLERNSTPSRIGIGRSLLEKTGRQDKNTCKPTFDDASSTIKKKRQPSESKDMIKQVNGRVISEQTAPCSSRNPGSVKSPLLTMTKGPSHTRTPVNTTRTSTFTKPSPHLMSGHDEKCKISTANLTKGGIVRRKGPPAKGSNPNKFYTASARLITEGSSSSSRGPVLGYRSTWADEMSDYLQTNLYELEEDEYDEELDDFIVDGECDEEFEKEDYSSAIKSIFGDRYLSAPYNDDDEVMESSFAQQQFEEVRSAHIGRLEDEEDMKKERSEIERKRKPKSSNSSSKKSKQLRVAQYKN